MVEEEEGKEDKETKNVGIILVACVERQQAEKKKHDGQQIICLLFTITNTSVHTAPPHTHTHTICCSVCV